MKCCIWNCKNEAFFRRWCEKHYKKWKNGRGLFCDVRGCMEPLSSKGLCRNHLHSFRMYGNPLLSVKAKNGSGCLDSNGYVQIRTPGRRSLEHILVAEKAMGHRMPKYAVVHHVNEIKHDNRPENLVICPSAAYHYLLHRRMDALRESGHADWLKCQYCKEYDSPESLTKISGGKRQEYAGIYHKECRNKYRRERIKQGKTP